MTNNKPWLGDCGYCDARARTLDHVIPGNENWLLPACLSCNAAKGHRTPAQWLKHLATREGPLSELAPEATEAEVLAVRKALLNRLRILRLRAIAAMPIYEIAPIGTAPTGKARFDASASRVLR